MPIKVTVKQQKAVVSSVNVGQRNKISLGEITNVDASDPDDGEALVYDAARNKYVVKELTVDANNITNIAGGIF